MKKGLVILNNYRHGGVSKSLESLLDVKTNNVEIDVFALSGLGIYKERLNNCTIIESKKVLHLLISDFNKITGWDKVFCFFLKILQKVLLLLNLDLIGYFLYRTSIELQSINYDFIIAFSEGIPTRLAAELKHENMIAWVHCDYANYLKLNNRDESRLYQKFRKIVCVSKYTKKTFTTIFPQFKEKVLVIPNIINVEVIVEKSKKSQKKILSSDFNIVSVGRIDPVKQFEKIPYLINEIMKVTSNFHWYLIGDGLDVYKEELVKNIGKFNVKNHFSCLGEIDNPYPYIAAATLVVVPSLSEASPTIVHEAKILGKPVICSNFGSSYEFIKSGYNGFILPLDLIPAKIIELISHKEKLLEVENNSKGFNYDNKIITEKINEMLCQK